MKSLGIFNIGVFDFVIEVPQWHESWPPTFVILAPHSPFHIFGKIKNELIGHTKLHTHHEDIIVREILPIIRHYFLDNAILEHPDDISSIDRIARKAIEFPSENTLCFSIMDSFDHFRKLRPPRTLGRLTFFKSVYYFDFSILSNVLHSFALITNGLNLTILVLF